jgi:hypothetical protein
MKMAYNFKSRFYIGNYEFQPAMDYSTNSMGVRIINTVKGEAMDVVSVTYALKYIQALEYSGLIPKSESDTVVEETPVVEEEPVNPKTGRKRSTKKATVVGGTMFETHKD